MEAVAGTSCTFRTFPRPLTVSSSSQAALRPPFQRLLLQRPRAIGSSPQLCVRASQSAAPTEEIITPGCDKIVEALKSVEVLNLDGKSIPLTSLWQDRRVVVGFTRHFGCVLCMKRADLLASCKNDFDAANVSLIIIGPGKVEQGKSFAASRKFPGEIYADPNAATHKALEFVSGVGKTFSLTSGLKVISAYLEGYRQDWGLSFDEDTRSKGGWQQGGILIAGPGSQNIVYLFKDAHAGDEPNMDEIVKAACGKA